MPVVNFHLPEHLVSAKVGQRLTQKACTLFAEVLDSPVERIRSYLTLYPSWAACTGQDAGASAFYQFFVLQDRPPEQVAALHKAFTELVAEELRVDNKSVRGACLRISPDDWGIAGLPASHARKTELKNRAEQFAR